jgi:hypothetical protein
MSMKDLRVKPGDPVLPAWEKLLKFIERFKIIPSPGIRLTQMSDGTYITAEPPRQSFAHPFRVAVLGGNYATVDLGTVEGIVPFAKDAERGGLKLDAPTPPRLRISEKDAKDGVSYVALRVATTMGGLDPEDSEAAEVIHVGELARRKEEEGLQPLAMLKWRSGTPEVFQIVHHNLGHYYVVKTEARGSRHLFFAK